MSSKGLKRKAKSLVALLIVFSIVLMPLSVIAENGDGDAGGGGDCAGDASGGDLGGADFSASDTFSFDNSAADTSFDIPTSGESSMDVGGVADGGAGDVGITDAGDVSSDDSTSTGDDLSGDAPADLDLDSEGTESAGLETDDSGDEIDPEGTTDFEATEATEVESAAVAAPESELAGDDCKEGNSYSASITPNGIAGAGFENEFTITFNEVGEDTIGSVRITLPGSIDDWTFNPETDIIAPSGKLWTGGLVGYVLDLWAKDSASYIDKNDVQGLSVNISGTPTDIGGYKFETYAWTDSSETGVGTTKNNPADSYKNLYPNITGDTEELWVGVRETIQEAIEAPAVLSGGTVVVNPGNYKEQIVINKSINLFGLDKPTIEAPEAKNRSTQIIDESTHTFDPIVFIDGGTKGIVVTVDGFVIDGNEDPGSSRFTGILARNVIDSVLSNNSLLNLIGAQQTLGIIIYGDKTDITVSENIISDFSRNAITIIDALNANVLGNTIVGRGYVGSHAQNGIQFTDVASGSIIDNKLSNIGWIWPGTGTAWTATGVLVYGSESNPPTININDNELTNVQVAIRTFNIDAEIDGNILNMIDPGELHATYGVIAQDNGVLSSFSNNMINNYSYGLYIFFNG